VCVTEATLSTEKKYHVIRLFVCVCVCERKRLCVCVTEATLSTAKESL